MAGEPAGANNAFKQQLSRELGLSAGDDGIGPLPSAESAAQKVRSYCAGGYTGAHFDTFGANQPSTITSDDLIALSMLSIHIREHSRSSLRPSSILKLAALAGRISELLDRVPVDRELHTLSSDEFEHWLGAGSPGEELYRLLRNEASIPRVAVHKLLARKRLLLMPIRDTVVEKALGQNAAPWWRPWWETLVTDPAVVAHLTEIRRRSGAAHLSLLRVADIAIWMAYQAPDDIGTA